MSPNECELTVAIEDVAGHAAVTGLIGRVCHTERRYRTLLVQFEFAIEPTRLPQLL
jgi:formate dehydrogenase assembly factor FdhD